MKASLILGLIVALATYGLRDNIYKFEPFQSLLSNEVLKQNNHDDTWTLQTDVFAPNHYQTAPYIANGYFGQTLPTEGVGYWVETNGSINGNFERGGESAISGIPDWTGLVVTTTKGDSYLPGVDANTVQGFYQSASIRHGIVHTNVTWKPPGEEVIFQLNFMVIAHRRIRTLGLVRLDLAADTDVEFTLTDVLDGAGAVRCYFGDKAVEETDDLIWTSVKPWGVETVSAYVFSTANLVGLGTEGAWRTRSDAVGEAWVSKNISTVAQSWKLKLKQNAQITAFKYNSVRGETTLEAQEVPWNQLVQEHIKAWDGLWDEADLVVPGNKELQISARSALFHLLANFRPGSEGPGFVIIR